MSPEQFIAPTPDPRSDLYSLALVAVRCLTGSLPPVVGPRVVVVPKDPRDAVGLRTMPVTAQWPEPVKACLCRALAWELSDRYPSPEAFAQELAQVISEWEPPTPGVREPWEGRLSGDHKTPAAAKTLVPARPPEPDRQIAPRAIPSLRLRLLGVSAFGVVAALVGTRLYLTQTGPGALPASIPAFPPSLNPPAPSPPSDSVAPRPASDPVDVPRVVPTAGRGLVLGDSVRQLDRLSDPSSMTAATAREAAELYARIQPELRTNLTRVGAAFFAARALAFLEREREACKILRDHEAMAATVPGYVEAYRASLSLCPE